MSAPQFPRSWDDVGKLGDLSVIVSFRDQTIPVPGDAPMPHDYELPAPAVDEWLCDLAEWLKGKDWTIRDLCRYMVTGTEPRADG